MIDEQLEEEFPATVRVAGVKIRDRGEMKKVSAGDFTVQCGDRVMLEVDGELAYGVVYQESQVMPFIPPMRMMRNILRPAHEADLSLIRDHERVSKEGMVFCRERASALGLKMKVVEVYRLFQRRETRFIYTSEERVDFRQLVRDLARRFGGRIEMRHIGPREEAQRLGGVDSCGLVLCCTSFLTDLRPIKVKEARSQGLPMEESRLLGLCGRLKCCLVFENLEPRPSPSGPKPPQSLIQLSHSQERSGSF